MQKLYSLILSIAFLSSAFAQSNENYDSYTVGTIYSGKVFTLNGLKYTITSSALNYNSSIENFAPLGDGSTDRFLLFDKDGFGGTSSIKIEAESGSPFNLLGLSFDGIASGNITINTSKNGTPLTYPSNDDFITHQNINTSANSNFQNITSFTISGGNLLLAIDDLSFGTVLPVTLNTYNLKVINNGAVELSWSTVSENNNSHFELSHSKDGVIYNLIAKVPAKGSNGAYYNYLFKDVVIGTNYFKLSQAGYDGEVILLEVEAINVALSDKTWNIYPNPIDDRFTVNIPTDNDKNKSVKIYNYSGKEIYNALMPVTDKKIQIILNNRIPAGNYIIYIEGLGAKGVLIK